jgi:hypothetical protein
MASSSSSAITRDNFDAHDQALQAAALKALKAAAGALPADIDFHRTLDSEYAAALDATAARVLAMTNSLLAYAEGAAGGAKGKSRLRDKDDVLDRFHAVVVDAMDGMLEQTVRSYFFILRGSDSHCYLSGQCPGHLPWQSESACHNRQPARSEGAVTSAAERPPRPRALARVASAEAPAQLCA